jgi:hypothetical protein
MFSKFCLNTQKISQYKSCAEFCGTHFIFKVAFQTWKGNSSKIQVKLSFTIHQHHGRQQLCLHVVYAQNIGRPAQKLFSYNPSTTLLFGRFEVVFEKFKFEAVKHEQMKLNWHPGALDRAHTSARRACTVARRLAYAACPRCPDPPAEPRA